MSSKRFSMFSTKGPKPAAEDPSEPAAVDEVEASGRSFERSPRLKKSKSLASLDLGKSLRKFFGRFSKQQKEQVALPEAAEAAEAAEYSAHATVVVKEASESQTPAAMVHVVVEHSTFDAHEGVFVFGPALVDFDNLGWAGDDEERVVYVMPEELPVKFKSEKEGKNAAKKAAKSKGAKSDVTSKGAKSDVKSKDAKSDVTSKGAKSDVKSYATVAALKMETPSKSGAAIDFDNLGWAGEDEERVCFPIHNGPEVQLVLDEPAKEKVTTASVVEASSSMNAEQSLETAAAVEPESTVDVTRVLTRNQKKKQKLKAKKKLAKAASKAEAVGSV
ncbi:MAG: hypothetical protein SGCHY_003248 [Lobulomycetales sp.]